MPDEIPWPDSFYILRAFSEFGVGGSVAIALRRIREYGEFAVVQQQRVEVVLRNTRASLPPNAPSIPVFPDVHLYFIVWGTIYNTMEYLCRVSRLPNAGRVLRQHRRELLYYQSGRNDFEHYDERMPGSPSANARPQLIDAARPDSPNLSTDVGIVSRMEEWGSGEIHGDVYTFAGLTWDIGHQSIQRLNAIIDEFVEAVRLETRDRVEEGDKARGGAGPAA